MTPAILWAAASVVGGQLVVQPGFVSRETCASHGICFAYSGVPTAVGSILVIYGATGYHVVNVRGERGYAECQALGAEVRSGAIGHARPFHQSAALPVVRCDGSTLHRTPRPHRAPGFLGACVTAVYQILVPLTFLEEALIIQKSSKTV